MTGPGKALACAIALAALVLAGCSDKPRSDGVGNADFDEFDAKVTETTGVIRGVVVDPAIRPVANALVTVQGTDRRMTTTEDGLFLFDQLDPGTYFLQASGPGFNMTQAAAEVVAGVSEPPITKILLQPQLGAVKRVAAEELRAFITCGFAVFATSGGCNTVNVLGDPVYFRVRFDELPMWTQGELVWKHTQPAGGQMIFQLAGCDDGSSNNPYCHGPPASPSPALTYGSTEVLEEHAEDVLENGVQYNIFGGPHEACSGIYGYGCGATVQQEMRAYLHHFYGFAPDEGWRFYYDGEPKVPE